MWRRPAWRCSLSRPMAKCPTGPRQRSSQQLPEPPDGLAQFFHPTPEISTGLGLASVRPSCLPMGAPVRTPADWQRRRAEILATWHNAMGPWPPLIEDPRVEVVNTTRRGNITQQQAAKSKSHSETNWWTRCCWRPSSRSAGAKASCGVGDLTMMRKRASVSARPCAITDGNWPNAVSLRFLIGKPNAQIDLTTTEHSDGAGSWADRQARASSTFIGPRVCCGKCAHGAGPAE